MIQNAPAVADGEEALRKTCFDRITDFYRHYDDSKVSNVAFLLAKYVGKEKRLMAELVKLYSPGPGRVGAHAGSIESLAFKPVLRCANHANTIAKFRQQGPSLEDRALPETQQHHELPIREY